MVVVHWPGEEVLLGVWGRDAASWDLVAWRLVGGAGGCGIGGANGGAVSWMVSLEKKSCLDYFIFHFIL